MHQVCCDSMYLNGDSLLVTSIIYENPVFRLNFTSCYDFGNMYNECEAKRNTSCVSKYHSNDLKFRRNIISTCPCQKLNFT
jgi:hypothetical protein